MKKTEIIQQLKLNLSCNIRNIKEARVNNEIKCNFTITDVIFIEPKIILPESIDKDDFEKAEEVAFERAQIRLCIDSLDLAYYCNGNATIKYRDNNFDIDLRIISIYSN